MGADGAAALARRAEAVQVGTQYLGNGAPQRIQFEFEGLTPANRSLWPKARGAIEPPGGGRAEGEGKITIRTNEN
jgi:hypothetical protein